LKRTATSIGGGLAAISKALLKKLIPALTHLLFCVDELDQLAQWPQKFALLGLNHDLLSSLQRDATEILLEAEKALQRVHRLEENFAHTFAWLENGETLCLRAFAEGEAYRRVNAAANQTPWNNFSEERVREFICEMKENANRLNFEFCKENKIDSILSRLNSNIDRTLKSPFHSISRSIRQVYCINASIEESELKPLHSLWHSDSDRDAQSSLCAFASKNEFSLFVFLVKLNLEKFEFAVLNFGEAVLQNLTIYDQNTLAVVEQG
jgi:hypothetical protein